MMKKKENAKRREEKIIKKTVTKERHTNTKKGNVDIER